MHMREELPPRIRRLRDEIIAAVPCQSDAHRLHLAALPFSKIMCVFVNYADRWILPRPRRVVYSIGFWDEQIAIENERKIRAVEHEATTGQYLVPRLSHQLRFRGYRPGKYDDEGNFVGNKWWNKDFALNVFGVHHLHLERSDGQRRPSQSDRLILVEVARDEMWFLLACTHSDLRSPSLADRVMEIRIQMSVKSIALTSNTIASVPSSAGVLLAATIALDGSSLYCGMRAAKILRALAKRDPLFDNRSWVEEQFALNHAIAPQSPEFEWLLQGTNLIMHEQRSGAYFPVLEGRQGYAGGPT